MKAIRLLMMLVMLAGISFTISSCGEGSEPEGTYIEISELPSVIVDYITTNYPGAQIEEAEVYPNGDYEVGLDSGIDLVFDADGNFVGEGD